MWAFGMRSWLLCRSTTVNVRGKYYEIQRPTEETSKEKMAEYGSEARFEHEYKFWNTANLRFKEVDTRGWISIRVCSVREDGWKFSSPAQGHVAFADVTPSVGSKEEAVRAALEIFRELKEASPAVPGYFSPKLSKRAHSVLRRAMAREIHEEAGETVDPRVLRILQMKHEDGMYGESFLIEIVGPRGKAYERTIPDGGIQVHKLKYSCGEVDLADEGSGGAAAGGGGRGGEERDAKRNAKEMVSNRLSSQCTKSGDESPEMLFLQCIFAALQISGYDKKEEVEKELSDLWPGVDLCHVAHFLVQLKQAIPRVRSVKVTEEHSPSVQVRILYTMMRCPKFRAFTFTIVANLVMKKLGIPGAHHEAQYRARIAMFLSEGKLFRLPPGTQSEGAGILSKHIWDGVMESLNEYIGSGELSKLKSPSLELLTQAERDNGAVETYISKSAASALAEKRLSAFKSLSVFNTTITIT